MSEVVSIDGLSNISNNYDVFILDQWGVMHDGKKGFKKAINCIEKLYLKKKKLIIISNSSKKKNTTIARLPELGFKNEFFFEVMTSGEMIWQSLIKKDFKKLENLGNNCFYIFDENKEDGKFFLKGLEKFNFVNRIEDADFILGCTPFANKKIIDYVPILNFAKKNELLFICANPDFDTVESNNKNLVFCMGTIAELYQNMGGDTFFLGKPSIEIYKESLKNLKVINKSKVLAIGDSIYHDIKGAKKYGIDSLLITSTGIHKDFFDKIKPNWQSNINKLNKFEINPTFICSDLKF